ncbi:hypothetical protein ISCGN_005186 [Ixodes scapularis]
MSSGPGCTWAGRDADSYIESHTVYAAVVERGYGPVIPPWRDNRTIPAFRNGNFTRAQKAHYDKQRRPTTVKVGDLVLCDAHTLNNASKGISAKLAARRGGPFRVGDQVGDNDFLLSNPASGRRQGIAHADLLALYHGPWEDRSPTASRLKRGRTVRREQRHGPSRKPRSRPSAVSVPHHRPEWTMGRCAPVLLALSLRFILVASLITCTRSHPTVPGIDIWPRSSNENYQNAKDRSPELSERSAVPVEVIEVKKTTDLLSVTLPLEWAATTDISDKPSTENTATNVASAPYHLLETASAWKDQAQAMSHLFKLHLTKADVKPDLKLLVPVTHLSKYYLEKVNLKLKLKLLMSGSHLFK